MVSLLAPFNVTNTGIHDLNSTGPTEAPEAPAAVPALPAPADSLELLASSEDVGAAIAALVMQSQKELRKSARLGRDAAYTALEAAQREELAHMREAANDRFKGSLLQGGFQLASAGASFVGAAHSAKAEAAQNKINAAPTQASAQTISGQEVLADKAATWNGRAKGFEAAATLAPAIANFSKDREEEAAKAAANRADKMKRVAEDHSDDVKDADDSLKKCFEFLRDWLSAKDAARSAALHRA